MSYTRQGISAGKHDIEQHGHDRVVKDRVTVNDYVTGGIALNPALVYGFTRITHVSVDVAVSGTYTARYDYDNNTVLVYNLGDGTEVADATTLDIDVVIRIEGKGGG